MNTLNATRRLSRFLSQPKPLANLDDRTTAVSSRAGDVFSSCSVSIERDPVIVTGRVSPSLIPSARDELGIYDLTSSDWREDFNLDAHIKQTNQRLKHVLDLPGASCGIAYEAKELLLNGALRVHADNVHGVKHLTVLVLVEAWTAKSARDDFNEVLSAEYGEASVSDYDRIIFIGTHPLASESLRGAARKASGFTLHAKHPGHSPLPREKHARSPERVNAQGWVHCRLLQIFLEEVADGERRSYAHRSADSEPRGEDAETCSRV